LERIFEENKDYVGTKSYESLIINLHRDLYRFIYIIVRNHVMAEEIIQEAFFQGYLHFKDLKNVEKFKSWMYTIAKREAISNLKKYSREFTVDIQKDEYILNIELFEEEGFEHSIEIFTAVKDIVSDLDSESRDIIYLIYHDKLTLEEISNILHLNINTLKSKHKRIKEKIYNRLKAMFVF